ncbi:MAG: PorP/SprF family type IX secretion system membrane protein [Chitinophagales bacterium]
MLLCCDKKYYISILLLILCCNIQSQDIHFSQFRLLPNVINPAFTGVFEEDIKIGLTYRNQSPTLNNVFNTVGFGIDASLFKQKRPTSIMGLGVHFYSDVAGSIRFAKNVIMLNYAYSQVLDKQYKFVLSFGIQNSLQFSSIDFSKITTEDAFNGFNNFDFNELTEYNLINKKFNYNIGSGILFTMQPTSKINAHIGFGAFNLVSNNVSWNKDNNIPIQKRYTLQLGAALKTKGNISILPNVLIQKQKLFSEYIFGSYVQYSKKSKNNQANEKYAIAIGTHYRWNDAVIIGTQFYYKKININIAYDVQTSKLIRANKSVGALEISLVYGNQVFKDRITPKLPIPCPKTLY